MNGETLRRLALRVLAVAFCAAALAGWRLTGGVSDTVPVALIDVSSSVGALPSGPPEGVRVRARWVLVADGVQEVVGGAEPSGLSRGATRLGEGLRLVAARHPGADVLVFTDGRDTDGDAQAGARRVAEGGGRVFVAPPTVPAADVGLLAARLVSGPPRAIIRAEVGSGTSGAVEVRLSRGGQIVDRLMLAVEPGGIRTARLEDVAPPESGCTYRVSLVPQPGTPNDDPGNDGVTLGLKPQRRVVLLWGLDEPPGLRSGPDLLVRTTQDLDAADLDGVDCLVLADVPWSGIGTEVTMGLERFVAGGGRLFVLGGPDAYAGGGWSGTPFEGRLLPLRVRRQEGQGLALVLALDRSGSTAGATLAHLREGARRALQGLTPGERMGLLPFAARPDGVLLEPGVVESGQPERLASLLIALDALEAGGDTDLPAAIEAAARQVAVLEASSRRVVLLTDGDPDDPPDEARLAEVARFLAEREIRFGALVVGDAEAAARLRRTLARAPSDVTLLDQADRLPRGLLHQLGDQRHRAQVLPAPARLVAVGASSLPLDVEALRPGELHHLEVALDRGADLLAIAEYVDTAPATAPFAASRRVGGGEVVALAWGPALEPASSRARALASLRPWIASLAAAADRGLQADVEGDALVVTYPQARGLGALRAVAGEDVAALVEVRPGLFRGPLPRGAGDGVRAQVPGRPDLERALRLPARPPPEHRGSGVDVARMDALAAAGGGRRLAPGVEPPAPARREGADLAPWLLLLAGILLVIDRWLAKPGTGATDPRGTRSP